MIYYVSKEGNNLNTGQSLAQSFLTITKGLQSVAAGDTLRIMPGIYNEIASCVTSGTAISNIDIVCCNDGIDNKTGALISANYKGKVIVSFIDNYRNEVASNAQFTFNTRQYVNLYGLQLNTKVQSISMNGKNCNVYNCDINTTGTTTRSIYGTATFATDNNNTYNCTTRGTYRGIEWISNVFNCNCNNANGGFVSNNLVAYCTTLSATGYITNNNTVNCTAVNNNTSYLYNTTGTYSNYNCISINSGTAITHISTSISNIFNFYSINTSLVVNVAGATNLLDISDIYSFGHTTLITGTNFTGVINVLTNSWSKNYFNSSDYEAIEIMNTTQNTSQLDYSTIRDIENKPLKLIDGLVKVGATQSSNIEYIYQGTQNIDYYLTPSTLKIKRKGVKCIRLRCKGGVQKTASVWLKYDLGGGTLLPQLLLRDVNNNKIVDEQDITLTAGSGFVEVTCTFTPKNDGVIELQVFNREAGVNSYCIISDFKLT